MAHFPIILLSFEKHMTCFRASLYVTLEWYRAFYLNNGARLWRRHGTSEKEEPEATASLSFPNIHPWACNLSCCQSACDKKFKFFPIKASNSADKLLYFQEDRDLYKFKYVQC